MKFTKIITASILSLCCMLCDAFCNDLDITEQIKYKEQLVTELKEEIKQIDSEMLHCQKAKKGWVAATVVGSVGVAATGTAAIIQTTKAKKQTSENEEQKAEKK